MIVLLTAFSLFHVFAGAASLGLAVRLLTAEERARWRSVAALRVAQAGAWVYPLLSLCASLLAWRAFDDARAEAAPLILAPLAWLLVMGAVFALIDFLDDGVIGNARSAGDTENL